MQTVIIGGGPAALAVALRLAERDPQAVAPDRLVVLDPAGRWLATWDAQMAAQRIGHLRSPAVHHPHPSPFALTHWLDQDRDLIRPDGIHLPSVGAFAGFCRTLVQDLGLDRTVRPHRALGLGAEVGAGVGGRRAVVATGEGSLLADRVVVATNPRRPCTPSWVGQGGAAVAARVVRGGDLGRRVDRSGQRIAVIGGGLSAAHLARGAVEDGAHVTLVARRPIVQRRMDTDPKWLGPTKMGPFMDCDPATRRALVDDARGGGSMPTWAAKALARLRSVGRLEVLEGVAILGAVAVLDQVALRTDRRAVVVDEVWLATGGQVDVCADPVLRDLATQHPVPVHGGLPELAGDLRWAGTPIHVVGAAAALQVGPVAGNLYGHREAAARVVASWMGACG